MYAKKRHTARFDTEKEVDLAGYDEILNNPLCTIIDRKQEKVREEHKDEEGNTVYVKERIVWVVTWEERQLL